VCRPVAGVCDAAEVCDGTHEQCPVDAAAPDDTSCDDGQVCSVRDHCDAGVCVGELEACGDGVQQVSCLEQCDDGNRTAGDGCDADCRLEPCRATPRSECRGSVQSGAGTLKLKRRDSTMPLRLDWSFRAGAATSTEDWGDPLASDSYSLCVYDGDVLHSATTMVAGADCDGRACWRERARGFQFDGEVAGTRLKLVTKAGADGRTSIRFSGRGVTAPAPEQIVGPLAVQLVTTGGTAERCWNSTFSAPFLEQRATELRARAD
jgi:cysteine-rich repeat protein